MIGLIDTIYEAQCLYSLLDCKEKRKMMCPNCLNSITYVHGSDDNRWIAFNRIYNIKYYDLNTYEREDRIEKLFDIYSQKTNRLEFTFHGDKTIISMDVS